MPKMLGSTPDYSIASDFTEGIEHILMNVIIAPGTSVNERTAD